MPPATLHPRLIYVAVQLAGALPSSLLVLLFYRAGGTTKAEAYLAVVPPLTIGMFAANRLWTFADRA